MIEYVGTTDDYNCLWDHKPDDILNKTPNQLKKEFIDLIRKNEVTAKGVINFIKNLDEFLSDNRTFAISSWEITVLAFGEECEYFNEKSFYSKFDKLMESEIVLEVFKTISDSRTNVGWNNFDAYIANGYKLKPGKSWPGKFINIYFVSNENAKNGEWAYHKGKIVINSNDDVKYKKILASNDPLLVQIPKITDTFEYLFVKTRGTIDKIMVDKNLNILNIKKWSAGKETDWIPY